MADETASHRVDRILVNPSDWLTGTDPELDAEAYLTESLIEKTPYRFDE